MPDPKEAATEVWASADLSLSDHHGTAWVSPAELLVLERVTDEYLAQHAGDMGSIGDNA